MQNKVASLGRRRGGYTFLLVDMGAKRLRQRLMEIVQELMETGKVPLFSQAVASDQRGHGGELLVVMPPSGNTDQALEAILAETADRCGVKLQLKPMHAGDYDAYDALLSGVARAHAQGLRPRLN